MGGLSVATAESIVPKLVIERSASLLKLLTATQGSRVEEIAASAKGLSSSVASYVIVERVKRFRRQEYVQAAVLALAPQSVKDNNLAESDQVPIYALLTQISGRGISSFQEAQNWWDEVQRRGCTLNPDKLKHDCPPR